MKSFTFFCPHCGMQLEKDAADWVLGDAGDASDQTLDPVFRLEKKHGKRAPEKATCPACRKGIDRRRLIQGHYDAPSGREWQTAIALLVVLVVLGLIVLRTLNL